MSGGGPAVPSACWPKMAPWMSGENIDVCVGGMGVAEQPLHAAGRVEAARAGNAHQDVDRLEAEPDGEERVAAIAHLVVVLGLAAGAGDCHGVLAGPPHDHFGVVDARARLGHLDLHGRDWR